MTTRFLEGLGMTFGWGRGMGFRMREDTEGGPWMGTGGSRTAPTGRGGAKATRFFGSAQDDVQQVHPKICDVPGKRAHTGTPLRGEEGSEWG